MDVTAKGKDPRIACIQRVSPSRASVLMCCPLAEAFRSAGTALRLPTHPKGHFGILVHSFFAGSCLTDVSTESERKQRWAAELGNYEKTLADNPDESNVLPLTETCDDFEVNSILAIKTALKMCKQAPSQPGKSSTSKEIDVSSEDGLIAGRLDKVRWIGGEAVITDLKTGKPTDAGGRVRQDLQIQLKLYAYLIHNRDGAWPKSIRIQPLSGDPVTVEFTPAEAEALACDVKEALKKANETVKGVLEGTRRESELANPSPTNCRFCSYRIGCDAYWEARKSWPLEACPPDLAGTLTSVIEQGGGFLLLGLDTAEGAASIRGFRLRFLRGINIGLKTGEAARACEMRRERAPRTFSCRPMTVLTQG